MVNESEFEGLCAFALSSGKTNVRGGTYKASIKGKTYVFSNLVGKILVQISPDRIKIAEHYWRSRYLNN